MGQRLNIEICKGPTYDPENCIANSYYHWSGYTGSAAALAEIIMSSPTFEKCRKNPTIENAVKLLVETGAGFDETEMEYARKVLSPDLCVECTSRNDGIIAISEEGKEDTRNWEEFRLCIWLDTGTADLNNLLYKVGENRNFDEDAYRMLPDYFNEDGSVSDKVNFYTRNSDIFEMNLGDIRDLLIYDNICFRDDFNTVYIDGLGNLYIPIE